MQEQIDFPLPRPVDDGAADHLIDMPMPHVSLRSTARRMADLSNLSAPLTVIYCYPMKEVAGTLLPEGQDMISDARGCTPQTCSFRDHHQELSQLRAGMFGLSTQTTKYQREMANRLHVPFEIPSDPELRLCDALRLPTFEEDGMRLAQRLTLIVRAGRIEHLFCPAFPPNESADQILRWLRDHPIPS